VSRDPVPAAPDDDRNADTDCVDYEGRYWPEHANEGDYTCWRCGAELTEDEDDTDTGVVYVNRDERN